MGSKNVYFLHKNDTVGIIDAFSKCLNDITTTDESILIDEFINSEIPIKSGKLLGSRLRVYVSRCLNGEIETTGIVGNIGSLEASINGCSSNSYSLEYLSDLYEIKSYKNFENEIKKIGVEIMESIIETEKSIKLDTISSQTDFIGIDLVISMNTEGNYKIYMIEVNDHESISCFASYELLNFPKSSNMLDKWIMNMLKRSYDYLLNKKEIALIGECIKIDSLILDVLQSKNLNVTLIVSCLCQVKESKYIKKILNFDKNNDNDQSEIVDFIIHNNETKIDCMLTFDESYKLVVEKVNQLKLKSFYDNITNINETLSSTFTIWRTFTYSYDIDKFQIMCDDDVDNLSETKFPIILKFLNKNKISQILNTKSELSKFISNTSANSNVYPLIAESYIFGYSFDVFLIIQERDLLFLEICRADCLFMNLKISNELLFHEKLNHVKYAAYDLCLKKGFINGLYFIKLILSPESVRLLKMKDFLSIINSKREIFLNINKNIIDLIYYYLLINNGIKIIKKFI